MKKYSILLLLAALSGCSLVPSEILSKEFIVEDIEGQEIPTALDNLTIVYGRIDLRFTNNYVSVKGDIFDTYAARIVKIVSGSSGEYKLFISDGSREKDKLRVNALYVTNGGKDIYGIGLSNNVNVDAPFPQVYTPSSMGSSEGKIVFDWAVDEARKPTNPLPGTHRGTYKSVSSTSGPASYKVSATGITSEGNGYSSVEEKFLRIVPSGADFECYTARSAYKITENGLYRGGAFDYNPANNVTFGSTPDAIK